MLITVGVTLVDTVTGGDSHHLPEEGRIDIAPGGAKIGRSGLPGHRYAVVPRCSHGGFTIDPCFAAHLHPGAGPQENGAVRPDRVPLSQQVFWYAVAAFSAARVT